MHVMCFQDYAPGTQKKVTGEVIRWNKATGPEKIDAVKYIELLEAEIDELSRQVARKTSQGSNELLEYLKSLEPQNLKVHILVDCYIPMKTAEDLMKPVLVVGNVRLTKGSCCRNSRVLLARMSSLP